MNTLDKFDPVPFGHPFGDFLNSLAGGDAPCCPRPDEFKGGMGQRFIAKWVGENCNSRANLFSDRFVAARPPASVLRRHFGAREAMVVLWLEKIEHRITVNAPIPLPEVTTSAACEDPGDEWEPVRTQSSTASTNRDSRHIQKEEVFGGCILAPTY